ncbi:TetR/AcrR family transcriptional regulator [Ferrovibrio sp.]|uniref:TetR/AcrR family transcriptional regulator n=1 Tax=Ferrovibrio sp. TaxID=1917215 RepID=UPI0031204CEB
MSTRKTASPEKTLPPSKRDRTRRRLLQAGVKVFAGKGIEAASIQEIAATAGVANGTFYNYFQSKEEIMEAAAIWVGVDYCEQIKASAAHIPDGAERMSIGGRHYMTMALAQPELARFMISVAVFSPIWAEQVEPYILADLTLGVKQKRFAIASTAAAIDMITGTNFAAINSLLTGRTGRAHIPAVSATILRGLGMAPKEADEIARRPLPPLPPAPEA